MDTSSKMIHAGDCCLNPSCDLYGQVGRGNIRKSGHTKQNRQRYQCKWCGQTYSERKGTVFYGLRVEEEKVVQALAMLAEGSRISSVARIQGIRADCVVKWLRRAGAHAEQVEEHLFKDYKMGAGELDGLWTYVRHKGEKKQA